MAAFGVPVVDTAVFVHHTRLFLRAGEIRALLREPFICLGARDLKELPWHFRGLGWSSECLADCKDLLHTLVTTSKGEPDEG